VGKVSRVKVKNIGVSKSFGWSTVNNDNVGNLREFYI